MIFLFLFLLIFIFLLFGWTRDLSSRFYYWSLQLTLYVEDICELQMREGGLRQAYYLLLFYQNEEELLCFKHKQSMGLYLYFFQALLHFIIIHEAHIFGKEFADLLYLLLRRYLPRIFRVCLHNIVQQHQHFASRTVLSRQISYFNSGSHLGLNRSHIPFNIIPQSLFCHLSKLRPLLHFLKIPIICLIAYLSILRKNKRPIDRQQYLLPLIKLLTRPHLQVSLEFRMSLLAEKLEFLSEFLLVVLQLFCQEIRVGFRQISKLHFSKLIIIHIKAISASAFTLQLSIMTEIVYELISATNFSQIAAQTFNRPTRSIISWQSTEFAVTPIELLFKLEAVAFLTQAYLHPKRGKHVKMLEVLVSEDAVNFSSIAKIYDLTDAVRIEISNRCRYLKVKVLEKEQGRPASIDLLRLYGHPYSKYEDDSLFHSQKKEQIEELLMQYGFNRHQKWAVDEQTLITLHDMTKRKEEYVSQGHKGKLDSLLQDFKTVLRVGEKIKELSEKKKYLNAKAKLQEIKDIDDQIKAYSQRRDFYDEKYETRRFESMIALDDFDNHHDELLKDLLLQDKQALEAERRRREEEAERKEMQLNEEFEEINEAEEEEWWRKEHELDQIQQAPAAKQKKPTVQKIKNEKSEVDQQYKFKNPYVYNQGDADMQKYIRPLLSQFTGDSVADPQLLRKYEQLEYLDVLGAKIWISAHSQNWRQRAAAVEAVLNFAQDKLPQRYNDGRTRNLFLALMEFARINAEDKVLQIYYTSLKIMTIALQPPICGQDVPAAVINKSIQKFISILIEKISEMNARAKEISLKQLITIFKHPVADVCIAINECLKVCREELNVKFIPVDKQNPRIIISRLQIIGKMMGEFRFQKRKVDFREILVLLIEGSLHHSSSEVRTTAVKVLQQIHRAYPQGTIQWFQSLNGLKPNIASELQQKLKIS